ncbi:MAG: thioredoxin [Bacillota bacterium]|nr:MAG: thioredoxin [Bacillota bacterium]
MKPITLTDDNFEQEVLNSDVPVLVDFWAPWCGPCRMMAPVIDELAEEYDGRIKVGKLNVDENPNSAGAFGIMSIPTLILFENGQPSKKLIGFRPKEEIVSELGI